MADEFIISDSENGLIDELRKRMTCDLDEKQYQDTYLFYRFLKARDFDLSQAEDMLRKHIQWRKQSSLETYKPPEVLQMYFKKINIAPTKYGSNIHYVATGKHDVRGMVLSAKYIDIEKSCLQMLEDELKFMREVTKRPTGWFPGFFLLLDMDGLSFAKATDKTAIEYFARFIRTFQDNYPECLGNVIIINASFYFTFIVNMIKPVLAQSILKKIHIFSKEGWQEELLKHADTDHLPAFLGGKKTDPDGNPLCLSFVNHGGPISPSYHLHRSKRSLAARPGVKKLVLARAAFSEIKVPVEEAGTLLEWEFETKNRDIGFGLFRKEGEGEKEVVHELVPLQRLETDNFAETGIYKCEKAGTYVLLFDNSYSWIRSKEIYYTMKVVSPNEQDNN